MTIPRRELELTKTKSSFPELAREQLEELLLKQNERLVYATRALSALAESGRMDRVGTDFNIENATKFNAAMAEVFLVLQILA
jgi:hypothetical protein